MKVKRQAIENRFDVIGRDLIRSDFSNRYFFCRNIFWRQRKISVRSFEYASTNDAATRFFHETFFHGIEDFFMARKDFFMASKICLIRNYIEK
jgi:hypothetical protein